MKNRIPEIIVPNLEGFNVRHENLTSIFYYSILNICYFFL